MNRLLIVTALMSEAVPLIDFYRMKKQPKQAHFHHYQAELNSESFKFELLVCGMGAFKMRQGLQSYFTTCDPYNKSLYMNFGIAGALEEPPGKLLWVESVGDTHINFPESVDKTPSYAVRSRPKASNDYQPGVLFDMEAETWLKCIAENEQEFEPGDLFCAKVVSDNQSEHWRSIDQNWVRKSVHKNIIQLDESITNFVKTIQ